MLETTPSSPANTQLHQSYLALTSAQQQHLSKALRVLFRCQNFTARDIQLALPTHAAPHAAHSLLYSQPPWPYLAPVCELLDLPLLAAVQLADTRIQLDPGKLMGYIPTPHRKLTILINGYPYEARQWLNAFKRQQPLGRRLLAESRWVETGLVASPGAAAQALTPHGTRKWSLGMTYQFLQAYNLQAEEVVPSLLTHLALPSTPEPLP